MKRPEKSGSGLALARRAVSACLAKKATNPVLLDYVDVVVHVFHEKTREYYLLERLWGDARRIEVADDLPA